MKNATIFLLVVGCLFSCHREQITDLGFTGDLTARSVAGVTYSVPDGITVVGYEWFLASNPDSSWVRIPGIHTEEIVLLPSYANQFLNCTVTGVMLSGDTITASVRSATPVAFRDNPNTDWFHDASYGIMVHFLKEVFAPEGGSREWNDAVNRFDVKKFASQAAAAKAGYVLFTLGQNSGYYCSPNAAFDKAVGIQPGELCSTRDLPKDLIVELDKYGIPLLLYLPSNPPIHNQLVSERLQYTFGKDSATSPFNQPILEDMIREWSLRYGTGVKGWWFDGLYAWNGIRSTRMDMSRKHNVSTHTLAAKAGNKTSIVTFNSGFGKISANTPYCDYSSGEKSTIDEIPSGRWVDAGVQWFLFTYLGEKWGGKGMQFETQALVNQVQKIVQNDGVVCLEVVTDSDGNILPHQFEQIKAVGEQLRVNGK